MAAGISSLFWGPISDRFGRKIILLLALTIFLGFTIVCILARTIIVLFIFRSLQGAAISALLVVGQSAIADMYPSDGFGFAIGLFLVPVLIGPIIGPFIGGVLSNTFGWRSTFVSLAIMAVISVLMILLFVPETHHYIVLQRLLHGVKKKRHQKNQTNPIFIREANTILKPRFMLPWRPLLALFDMTIAPYVAVCNINCAALFISLTLMSNRESQNPYALSPLHIGFSYIPTGVSSLLGSLSGGWVSDWSAKRFYQAMEGRLILNLIGSLLCPLGLLLCGWTFHFGIHLALPLIGSSMFCFGQAFMYTSACAFVNVKNPATAGSILALINSLNFICSGIGIIVTVPLLTLMQFGPLFKKMIITTAILFSLIVHFINISTTITAMDDRCSCSCCIGLACNPIQMPDFLIPLCIDDALGFSTGANLTFNSRGQQPFINEFGDRKTASINGPPEKVGAITEGIKSHISLLLRKLILIFLLIFVAILGLMSTIIGAIAYTRNCYFPRQPSITIWLLVLGSMSFLLACLLTLLIILSITYGYKSSDKKFRIAFIIAIGFASALLGWAVAPGTRAAFDLPNNSIDCLDFIYNYSRVLYFILAICSFIGSIYIISKATRKCCFSICNRNKENRIVPTLHMTFNKTGRVQHISFNCSIP
ncbi:unnamed protein product [Rotaria sp. Silwood2]|nr:unnamed protein product [Rotaria sp. Silwood2]CAF4268074.1 unnamed protein product [Rotaria sp. Silwood2]